MADSATGATRIGLSQVVAYTGTQGVIANPVGAGTRMVRVTLSTAGHVAIGVTPVASTSTAYMPANWPEYFTINPGEKVSALQVAAGGNLHVTEVS